MGLIEANLSAYQQTTYIFFYYFLLNPEQSQSKSKAEDMSPLKLAGAFPNSGSFNVLLSMNDKSGICFKKSSAAEGAAPEDWFESTSEAFAS